MYYMEFKWVHMVLFYADEINLSDFVTNTEVLKQVEIIKAMLL